MENGQEEKDYARSTISWVALALKYGLTERYSDIGELFVGLVKTSRYFISKEILLIGKKCSFSFCKKVFCCLICDHFICVDQQTDKQTVEMFNILSINNHSC